MPEMDDHKSLPGCSIVLYTTLLSGFIAAIANYYGSEYDAVACFILPAPIIIIAIITIYVIALIPKPKQLFSSNRSKADPFIRYILLFDLAKARMYAQFLGLVLLGLFGGFIFYAILAAELDLPSFDDPSQWDGVYEYSNGHERKHFG